MIGVNLIPESRRELLARRSRVRIWCGVLIATTILSGGGAAAFRAAWLLERGPLQPRIDAARAASAESHAALVKVRGEIAGLNRATLAARTVGEHPDWSVLLRAVNHIRGDSISLNTFELKTVPPAPPPARAPGDTAPPLPPVPLEKYSLVMRGIATDLTEVMSFIEKLENLGALESVTMKQSRAELNRGVSVTGFDIECVLAEGPAATTVQPKASDAATAAASTTEDRP
jgi:hypothetical protein